MSEDICACKRCKRKPRIINIDGLFYVQCPAGCDKWSPYEHLGLTEQSAIKTWNIANSRNQYIE